MQPSGDDMNKPSWFSTNLTLGNIVTLVVILSGGVYGYGKLESRVETIVKDQARVEVAANEKFASIARSLENVPNLAYRITAQEEALRATNQRVDASLANISQRLAEINQALGSLDTKVAVLTQRLELSVPQRRAENRPPN